MMVPFEVKIGGEVDERVVTFSARSNQERGVPNKLSSKHGHFWLQRKMAPTIKNQSPQNTHTHKYKYIWVFGDGDLPVPVQSVPHLLPGIAGLGFSPPPTPIGTKQ